MFHHPFCCIVSGPTKSGKSTFISEFVKCRNQLMDVIPRKVIYCYTEWQPLYDKLQSFDPTLIFHLGPPGLEYLQKQNGEPVLLILDDLMQNYTDVKSNEDLKTLFTRGAHHWNISCIHIVQNLFHTNLRTARINSHYIVLMKNPADKAQALNLQRQIFPGEKSFFLEALTDAWNHKQYGYLLIDLSPHISDELRLRTSIFPYQQQFSYIKKDKRKVNDSNINLNQPNPQCLLDLKEI